MLASLLLSVGNFSEANTVLEDSLKVTLKPSDVAGARRRIAEIKQIQDVRAQTGAASSNQPQLITVDTDIKTVPRPRHPIEPAVGPKHWTEGVINDVRCSYPAEIEFQVTGASGNVAVYSSDFTKLDITAVGFTPTDTLNPCDDLRGTKVRVQYAESSDKTITGQVVAIEIHK